MKVNNKKTKPQYFFPLIPGFDKNSDPIYEAGDILPIINSVTDFLLIIAAIVIVGMIVWAGALYAVSGGSEERIGKAKQALTAAITGLVIILCSYAAINFFQYILTGSWS